MALPVASGSTRRSLRTAKILFAFASREIASFVPSAAAGLLVCDFEVH